MTTHKIIFLNQIDSTNTYAEKLLESENPEDGTIIVTHNQTAGKGQGTNTWSSEPGKNLTFSIILYPLFLHPSQQFLLNKAIALSVLDFVKTRLPVSNCTLKWPNDIYAGSKKLGGILIRNMINGEMLSSTIAGIGLNLNQLEFDPVLPNPVSVKQLTGKDLDPLKTLNEFLPFFDNRYEELVSGNFPALDTDYNSSLLGFHTWRKFVSPDLCFDGFIKGVDEYGLLVMETKFGEKTFNHGELEFLL